ncbi:MAG: hypothetical protein WDN46_06395 [Methylocella sp.]
MTTHDGKAKFGIIIAFAALLAAPAAAQDGITLERIGAVRIASQGADDVAAILSARDIQAVARRDANDAAVPIAIVTDQALAEQPITLERIGAVRMAQESLDDQEAMFLAHVIQVATQRDGSDADSASEK